MIQFIFIVILLIILYLINLYFYFLFQIFLFLIIHFIINKFLILIFYSYRVAMANMSQASPALLIPYGYIYMAIPAGGVLMTIFSLSRIKRIITGEEQLEQSDQTK